VDAVAVVLAVQWQLLKHVRKEFRCTSRKMHLDTIGYFSKSSNWLHTFRHGGTEVVTVVVRIQRQLKQDMSDAL
jgi:hypothetical protein